MRIAAVGDIHYGVEEKGPLHAHLDQLAREADVLLVAGDLTRHGDPAEARELAADLAVLDMPKLVVLGNHDYHSDKEEEKTFEEHADSKEVFKRTFYENEAVAITLDYIRLLGKEKVAGAN